jgi:4'-phosphopantetheinyl transferase
VEQHRPRDEIAMHVAPAWQTPPRELQLQDNEVHLGLMALPTQFESLPTYKSRLTDEERQRADRFHFPEDRARFTLGRAALRILLMRYSGLADISLALNEYGKPFLAQPGTSLQFNVAHSGDLVLLGFTRGRSIGVDVERLRPDFATTEIADRFFAPDEAAIVAALPEPERARGFFNCWTRKEAYIKARGLGLSLPLHSFSVTFTANESPALLRADNDPTAPQRWTIVDLPTCDGYAAATAFEARGLNVSSFLWVAP